MKMIIERLASKITKVTLSGHLDADGIGQIADEFLTLCNQSQKVLVDLSGVDLLSSFGVRTLLHNAHVVGQRGGKLVMLNPQPMPKKTLKTIGADQLVPVFDDLETAIAAFER